MILQCSMRSEQTLHSQQYKTYRLQNCTSESTYLGASYVNTANTLESNPLCQEALVFTTIPIIWSHQFDTSTSMNMHPFFLKVFQLVYLGQCCVIAYFACGMLHILYTKLNKLKTFIMCMYGSLMKRKLIWKPI